MKRLIARKRIERKSIDLTFNENEITYIFFWLLYWILQVLIFIHLRIYRTRIGRWRGSMQLCGNPQHQWTNLEVGLFFSLFYRLIIYCRWYSTADWLLMLLWLIFTTVHKLSEFLCQCSCEIPQNMFKTFSRFLIKYLSESRSIFEYWRNHIYEKNQTLNLKTSKKFGRNLLEVYRFIWFQLLLL